MAVEAEKARQLIDDYLPITLEVLKAYGNDSAKQSELKEQLISNGPLALVWAGELEAAMRTLAKLGLYDALNSSSLLAMKVILAQAGGRATTEFYLNWLLRSRIQTPVENSVTYGSPFLFPSKDIISGFQAFGCWSRRCFPMSKANELLHDVNRVSNALDLRHIALWYSLGSEDWEQALQIASENLNFFPGSYIDHGAKSLAMLKLLGVDQLIKYYNGYLEEFPARQGCAALEVLNTRYGKKIQSDMFEVDGKRHFVEGSSVPALIQRYYQYGFQMNRPARALYEHLRLYLRRVVLGRYFEQIKKFAHFPGLQEPHLVRPNLTVIDICAGTQIPLFPPEPKSE